MYRIRFHGRGGQGMKTASRFLGTALFRSGWEVQDAPKYGAERRGAPMFAYVRACRRPIHERGNVSAPDLIMVADETLFQVPSAAVLSGLQRHTVVAVAGPTAAEVWRDRLQIENPVYVLPRDASSGDDDIPDVSALMAGAAARLTGLVSPERLREAVEEEVAPLGNRVVAFNQTAARQGFDAMAAGEGAVVEGRVNDANDFQAPAWVDLDLDLAATAAPNIYDGANSVEVRTGLWRTMRPVLRQDSCAKCNWVCGSSCPDGVIEADAAGFPIIDYDHCKGCMICVTQCPRHALEAVLEETVQAAQAEEETVR